MPPDDEPDRNAAPYLDRPTRSRHEAALEIAVKALLDVRENGALCVHTAHWDSKGTSGANCPVCEQQRGVAKNLRDALDKIAALVPDAVK